MLFRYDTKNKGNTAKINKYDNIKLKRFHRAKGNHHKVKMQPMELEIIFAKPVPKIYNVIVKKNHSIFKIGKGSK